MIKITGDRGEGAGLLTNLAIEKLLETQLENFPHCLCFLIDDSGEFSPLVQKLQGINIDLCNILYITSNAQHDISKKNIQEISQDREEKLDYFDYVKGLLSNKRFFRFIVDWDCKNEFYRIEKLANEIQNEYHLKVFIIHKSVNK